MDNKKIVLRIKVLIEKAGVNPNKFADMIGFDKSNLSKVLRGDRNVPEKLITSICENLGVSYKWIMYGEGSPETDASFIGELTVNGLVEVAYVPIDANASFIETLDLNETRLDTWAIRPKEGEDLTNGDYIVFQVRGHSMLPIQDGAIILAKIIPQEKWETAEGLVFVVYGKTLTLKRILKNSLCTTNILTLRADNPIYGQADVQRSEIRGMWQAIRIVEQDLI